MAKTYTTRLEILHTDLAELIKHAVLLNIYGSNVSIQNVSVTEHDSENDRILVSYEVIDA